MSHIPHSCAMLCVLVASSLPSGLKARLTTKLKPRLSVWTEPAIGCALAEFHSWTLPSALPLASSLPSGLKATLYTPGSGPTSAGKAGSTPRPVRGFHNKT
jgi:hypothetical protein